MSERKQSGQVLRKHFSQHLVANHGDKWAELTDQQKAGWHDRALARREEQQDVISEQLDQARKKRKTLEEELNQARDGPLLLSHCRFSSAELARFDAMWHSDMYSHSQVELQVAKLQEPLQPVVAKELSVLAGYPGPASLPSAKSPEWAYSVCRHRDIFEKCILRLEYEDDGCGAIWQPPR